MERSKRTTTCIGWVIIAFQQQQKKINKTKKKQKKRNKTKKNKSNDRNFAAKQYIKSL